MREWIWFARRQMHHYRDQAEPTLFPELYAKMIEVKPNERVIDVETLQQVLHALEKNAGNWGVHDVLIDKLESLRGEA